MAMDEYSSASEARRIVDLLLDLVSLPPDVRRTAKENVLFKASRDLPYFPIPFMETEVGAALKAIEGSVASSLADLQGRPVSGRQVTIDLEKTTAFLFQAYLATVGGHGKLDSAVKRLLKDTDLLRAQSDPYRRMSANLYETKDPGRFYHIHGSLEASTTLRMLGLAPFRGDLNGNHDAIVESIETAVRKNTVEELEEMNARNRQAGVPALTHAEFLRTPHGKENISRPPWTVEILEETTPSQPMTGSPAGRVLTGIKVVELCRIIAGPVIGRILAEYGADVLKITSPNLSDVPFFQVDGNMGKHAAELDLKTPEGRQIFEQLLIDADVILDGYRPGALEKLGYGPQAMAEIARRRGKGIVYVSETCFGYDGEWASRPGWQQIADCVTGVAWEQGKFMGLSEPVVPPFPISDYGTGCMGAIAALTGLYYRATRGGSWHGKVSLMHYDLLLFKAGKYPEWLQEDLRQRVGPKFLALKHSHSVDQISGTAMRSMQKQFPDLFDRTKLCEAWHSEAYKTTVVVVKPVVEIDGVQVGFQRASRPNGSDPPTWNFDADLDRRL